MVEQSARAGGNDIHARTQFGNLALDADASIDGRAGKPGLLSQLANRLVGLFGQFPCGREDQGANLTRFPRHQAL